MEVAWFGLQTNIDRSVVGVEATSRRGRRIKLMYAITFYLHCLGCYLAAIAHVCLTLPRGPSHFATGC